jgi:hypothetical protein
MKQIERRDLMALRDKLLKEYDETEWREGYYEETYDDAWFVPGNEDAQKIAESAIEGIEEQLGLESTLQKRRDEKKHREWQRLHKLREKERRQDIDSIARQVKGKVDTYLCEEYNTIPRETVLSVGKGEFKYTVDGHNVTEEQFCEYEKAMHKRR